MSDPQIDMTRRGLKPVSVLGASRPHGVRLRYMSGCRCLKCRMANANYETMRADARRRGEGNGLVDTAPGRAHLRKLSRLGIGYKAVADAASISRSTIEKVRSGKRTKMRRMALLRLLAVTPAARADHSFVPAGPTWKRIGELLQEGFTKARIARELGYKTRAIQFRRDQVLACTELAVERLWRRYME